MTETVDPAPKSPTTDSPGRRRVAVVIGSTRPNRICAGIAEWTARLLRSGGDVDYELLDLAEVNLPFLDESLKAALGRYEHEHTRAWSRLVSSFDGFVFVFPQYNWGYPAPLKNALDFLYAEWRDKPAGMVTYGTRGGERGAAQLRTVLQGVKMRTVEHNVELSITAADVDDMEQLIDLEATLAPFAPAVHALAEQLGAALADGSGTDGSTRTVR
jgi:NAD(P)H-dependent FMN reductase